MNTIRISHEDFLTPNYKEIIWGTEEEFDECFVIKGNSDYIDTDSAEWFTEVKYMLSELDSLFTEDEWREAYNKLSTEQQDKIIELYTNCRVIEDIYVDVLNIIHPDSKYVERTITGSCQREWQRVIYDSNKVTDETLNELEAYYFGYYVDVYCEEQNIGTYIPDYVLWDLQRHNKLKEEVIDMLGLDADEPIEIYESDGYIRTVNWKKVG